MHLLLEIVFLAAQFVLGATNILVSINQISLMSDVKTQLVRVCFQFQKKSRITLQNSYLLWTGFFY